MFILFSKTYGFDSPYTPEELYKIYDRDVGQYTYRQLRKDFHLTDLYYGGRDENELYLHFHRFGKRDLDNVYYHAKVTETPGGSRVEGRFRKKTKDIVITLLIMAFWIFAAAVGFTQNVKAGLVLTLIVLIAFYIFFWDNNTPDEIKSYLEKLETKSGD